MVFLVSSDGADQYHNSREGNVKSNKPQPEIKIPWPPGFSFHSPGDILFFREGIELAFAGAALLCDLFVSRCERDEHQVVSPAAGYHVHRVF